MNSHKYVYGPVQSWRYGRSLGIDPIGAVSTCSFNCVYCQLGEIEQKTRQRSVYVTTNRIIDDLKSFFPWEDVDIITLSGSGEPTLGLNLGEILTQVGEITAKPTLVLTNGTLLSSPQVREQLNLADKVSVKLDGANFEQIQRIDRPVPELNWSELQQGLRDFATQYPGELSIQTMVLAPWSPSTLTGYIEIVSELAPKEIQLNIPRRPKPLAYQVDARGNHSLDNSRPYEVKQLRCVNAEVIKAIASAVNEATKISVRWRSD